MDVVEPVAHKPWQEWSEEEVAALVASISNVCLVDLGKSLQKVVATYQMFVGQWPQFLTFHLDIVQQLDLYYVITDLAMALPPAGYAAAIATYPAGSPHPALPATLNGAGYIWPFPMQTDADHFIGWMQHACGGLRFWCFNCLAGAVLYF